MFKLLFILGIIICLFSLVIISTNIIKGYEIINKGENKLKLLHPLTMVLLHSFLIYLNSRTVICCYLNYRTERRLKKELIQIEQDIQNRAEYLQELMRTRHESPASILNYLNIHTL